MSRPPDPSPLMRLSMRTALPVGVSRAQAAEYRDHQRHRQQQRCRSCGYLTVLPCAPCASGVAVTVLDTTALLRAFWGEES